MKKLLSIFMAIMVLCGTSITIFAKNDNNYKAESISADFTVDAKSAVLIEASTGTVIFEQNSDEALPPASVTKIMTLLLIAEALSEERISLEDKVSISDKAASMGGSQVFLEEGEVMTVEELLKCTVIASANDAALALAEFVSGSEEAFVTAMNTRAKQMGLKNTFFENVTGLDDTTQNHLTSAKDIALMSCELIKYPIILKYSSLWQDTIRDGEFTLTNTNRLVRYYDGCNGLKTGSTAKAGYCVSASAKRGEMQLVAVVMGAETRDERNRIAKSLLDFGFANYALFSSEERVLENVKVYGGNVSNANLYQTRFCALVPKSDLKKVVATYEIPEFVTAPQMAGNKLGKITYKIGDTKIGESDIIIKENLDKTSASDIFIMILKKIFLS